MTITIADALKAQPGLAEEAGYKKWIQDDDWAALDEALDRWGFGKTNDEGEIQE